VIGAHPVVVLGYDYWTTRFGADPTVVNDTLVVNGEAMTIVGVAPHGFNGMTTINPPEVFIPLAMAHQAFRDPAWNGLTARNSHWLYLFGRLAPGVSRDRADAQINPRFAALIRDVEYPALRSGIGSDLDRQQFQQRTIVLRDGARGQAMGRDQIQSMLLLMFAVTGFVLTIACANVANLLLARATDRTTEMAVRLALGASSRRLVRLLLIEAALLGALGSAGALAIARITLNGLLALMPAEDASTLTFQVDSTVLLFTFAVGVTTSVLFGLFPAFVGVRTAVGRGLQAHASRITGSRAANRFRASMATTQVALATALLAVSGLFILSLINITRLELGIRREGLITFRLSPDQNGYTPERARALFARLEDEVRALPGVDAVTATTQPILANSMSTNNLTVEGFDAGPDADTNAANGRTSIDYFRTLGIPLVAGREFTIADTQGSVRVAVVNEAFARKFNLGSHTIGTHFALGSGGNRPLNIEIVGLVRDARFSEVKEPVPAQFYTPYRQADVGSLTFYVRGGSDTRPLVGMIPSLLRRIDANLPVENLRTMDDQIWDNTSRDRVLTTLSSAFAVLAVVLAAIGLYAMLAYGVAQRLREIGIRIALGAKSADVRRLVLSQVGRISLVGGLVGGGLALGLGRIGQTMLFGVHGYDVSIIGGAMCLVLLVVIAASVLPARRATSVDPVTVLRAE
jgi:predicted permease